MKHLPTGKPISCVSSPTNTHQLRLIVVRVLNSQKLPWLGPCKLWNSCDLLDLSSLPHLPYLRASHYEHALQHVGLGGCWVTFSALAWHASHQGFSPQRAVGSANEKGCSQPGLSIQKIGWSDIRCLGNALKWVTIVSSHWNALNRFVIRDWEEHCHMLQL